MDTNLFTIAPVIIDINDQSRLDVSLNKIRILKMKYFHRFTIFIIIILFSVSPSFSQDWRKLTTQEFKNIIGKKIKNKECNFKFEEGGITRGSCTSARYGTATFLGNYTFVNDNYCSSSTTTMSNGKTRDSAYKCSTIYVSGNKLKFGDDVYSLETKKKRISRNELKIAFNNLSSEARKKIQLGLQNQGYYKSGIDGSYGKGTEKALRDYNSDALGGSDLKKSSNVAILLSKLSSLETLKKYKVIEKKHERKTQEEAVPNVNKSISSEWEALAEEGSAKAQYKLALMYEKGEGFLQDFVYAHMWANLSVTNGYTDAKSLRDELANKMTPSQMEKAQDLARKCLKKNYQGC